MKHPRVLPFALFVMLLSVSLFAQVPRTMNYQCKLTDGSNNAIDDADRVIAFLLYDVESGGTALWGETLSVNIVNGLFDIQLGAMHTMNLPFDEPYWIQMKIDENDDGDVIDGADEFLTPREKLAPVSYSHRAVYADSVDNYIVQHDATITGEGTASSPLHSVGDNWGTQSVMHDGTLSGGGTSGDPLVVIASGGGDSGVHPDQQIMFWEAYFKYWDCVNATSCADQIMPNWADTSDQYWARALGGNNHDYAVALIPTSDGGYAMGGLATTYSSHYLITKFSSNGAASWSRTIFYNSGSQLYFSGLAQVSDGGYLTTGCYAAPNYMYLVKLNSMGNFAWARYWHCGYTNYNIGEQVIEASDGDYVVFGTMYDYLGVGDNLDYDMAICKFNTDGSLDWARAADYTGAASSSEYCYAGVQASDGGFVMAGYYGGLLILVKLDSSGNLVWSEMIAGVGNTYYSIIKTSDNGFLVSTSTSTYGAGSNDFFLLKFASDGTFQWARTAGGASNDLASSVIQTNDGGYALFGQTESFGAGGSDFLLVKFNSSGDYLWARTYGGTSNENTIYCNPSIFQNASGFLTFGGYTSSYGAGNSDYCHIRAGSNGDCCFGETAPVGISAPTPTVTDITASTLVGDPSLTVNSLSPAMTTPAPTSEQICGP